MRAAEVLYRLRSMADPSRLEGMSRYGIPVDRALGVSVPQMRSLAREIGRDHRLARELWATGVHEAMVLSGMIDEPSKVTGEQMDSMVNDLYSWDLCDQCCNNLFRLTPCAWDKALEWSSWEGEFQRRAGFTLMAVLAVHDRRASDEEFDAFLKAVQDGSADGRLYVKKAVNWALRQIGKRNLVLNLRAVQTAMAIARKGDAASKWVASDALRELRDGKVRQRLMKREGA